MAIDTESKRRSVQAYAMGFVEPLANGSVDQGDRATVAFLYYGLTYAAPSGAVAVTPRTWHLPSGYGHQALKGNKGYSK